MAFQVARSHARWLCLGASALVLGGPLLAWLLLAAGLGTPVFALATAAVLLLAGAFVERWLLFAQARHEVTLYYSKQCISRVARNDPPGPKGGGRRGAGKGGTLY